MLTKPRVLMPWKHFGEKFSCVNTLYFVRDPFEWLSSAWVQRVKRNGEMKTMSDYWLAHRREVAHLEDFMYVAGELGWNITLRKYTRSALIDHTTDWLGGVFGSGLEWPDVTVNRTLTFAEIQVMRALFPVYGIRIRKLADELCNDLPDIEGYAPTLDHTFAFDDETVASIERLNGMLVEHGQEPLRTKSHSIVETAPHNQGELNRAQRRIIDNWLKRIPVS
jgi:hypothetical protein